LSWRSKHIAHSVNDLEENKVVAYYVKERTEDGFNSISVQHGRVISLSSGDLDVIMALCEKFLAYIKQEMENEKADILRRVNLLPIETVLSSGMARV